MASILNSKAERYRYEDSHESHGAEDFVESEADIFIKALSHRQLRTNITLEQLKKEKEFHSSHSYQPITQQTSGGLSYEEFKRISTAAEHKTDEIPNSDVGAAKNVSRHMHELALAVKPNSTETRLLEFAIACNAAGPSKPDNRPEDHPINCLHDLENELFGHLTETGDPEKTAKTILRKRKQLLEATSDPIVIKSKPRPAGGKSLWDVDEPCLSSRKKSHGKVYSCQNSKLFTIEDGKIISLDEKLKKKPDTTDQPKIIPEQSINYPTTCAAPVRISEDEIKNLQKFQNYQRGIPAETLYLKNLSNHVTEEDLSSWFGEFQRTDKPRIIYNLMKSGKMRGQAFIHFHCIDSASKALEKLNGCIMYGKPLVIQFSKSQR